MRQAIEILIVVHIILGSMFLLVGSLGMVKLPTLMARLHAPSKATTLGVGGYLIASILQLLSETGKVSVQEVLITLFLFITAPVTAHFIAKAYIHMNPDEAVNLPKPGSESAWSTIGGYEGRVEPGSKTSNVS